VASVVPTGSASAGRPARLAGTVITSFTKAFCEASAVFPGGKGVDEYSKWAMSERQTNVAITYFRGKK